MAVDPAVKHCILDAAPNEGVREWWQDVLEGEGEELHPDLAEYTYHDDRFGTCIKHPLYFQLMHMPQMNRLVNKQFALKRQACEELLAEGKYETWVWLHERAYRLWAFAQIADKLKPGRYWTLLGELWTDSENIGQLYQDWHNAWHSDRPQRWRCMTARERGTLRKLRARKTPILVYRGYCYDGGETGLSWTTDRRRAEWFARRFAGMDDDHADAMLATGICDAKSIVACFDGRDEKEVVVLPEDVHITKIAEVAQ